MRYECTLREKIILLIVFVPVLQTMHCQFGSTYFLVCLSTSSFGLLFSFERDAALLHALLGHNIYQECPID